MWLELSTMTLVDQLCDPDLMEIIKIIMMVLALDNEKINPR
jgi:hypothetical protein